MNHTLLPIAHFALAACHSPHLLPPIQPQPPPQFSGCFILLPLFSVSSSDGLIPLDLEETLPILQKQNKHRFPPTHTHQAKFQKASRSPPDIISSTVGLIPKPFLKFCM